MRLKFRIIHFFIGITGMLIFEMGLSSICLAEDYYAITEHQIQSRSGKIYAMQTITKVSDENVCKNVSNQKGASVGRWESSGSDCVTGQEYDQQFADVFTNQPISGLYIAFTDLDGYETRVKFVRLTGSDSPVPGFPVDLSTDDALVLAKELIKSLEAGGIKDTRIIYPD